MLYVTVSGYHPLQATADVFQTCTVTDPAYSCEPKGH